MSDTQTYTVVVTTTFNQGWKDSPELQQYSEKVNELIWLHKGSVVSKKIIEKNLGNWTTPDMMVMIEFPSKDDAIQTFSSSQYEAIIPLRDIAFKQVNIFIVG